MTGRPSVRRTLAGVLAAQLLTAVADNALLIVAIAMLESGAAPAWATPALRICFYAAYVLLAPVAGPLADRWPKGRLMLLVNLLEVLGAGALACGAAPLLVFGVIGLGAAAYAPARYGILPELASGRALVRANAAMEIVTIIAILAGVALGSAMVAGGVITAACCVLAMLYALAAASTLLVRTPSVPCTPGAPFGAAIRTLLVDRAARFSLGITSVFWACAAVLQFLMIAWARKRSGCRWQARRCYRRCWRWAWWVARWEPGSRTSPPRVAPSCCAAAAWAPAFGHDHGEQRLTAGLLLLATGVLAGALLVPMNAVLQQRGATLVRPGVSVAVQNFLENGLSLGFLALYGLAVALGASVDASIYALGVATVVLVGCWRWASVRRLARLLHVGVHLLSGLLQCAGLFPFLGTRARNALVQRWSRGMMRVFRIQVRSSGPGPGDAAGAVVANHVSWIDVFVLNAGRPVSVRRQSRGARLAVHRLAQRQRRHHLRGPRRARRPDGSERDHRGAPVRRGTPGVFSGRDLGGAGRHAAVSRQFVPGRDRGRRGRASGGRCATWDRTARRARRRNTSAPCRYGKAS